ncbi:MAG: HPr(Ser) kinase/phosphatase [Ruminococcaceae bacterium]|nr:HPr(Ser) kinase/phosphatase [Oscillospiraceae bacterium]
MPENIHETEFSVSLNEIIKEFKLEQLNRIKDIDSIMIKTNEVNRTGLPLAGFFDYFQNARIQIIGRAENTYLNKLPKDTLKVSLENFFKQGIPALVLSRNIEPLDEIIDIATKYNTPVLRTSLSTSRFLSALIAYLNVMLAQRETRHGVLIEVYGEGILLLADSGVGKSETAIELVKRGHRLVADDAVEIKKVSDKSLVGSAPEIIRHFIELRGIGIVDVKQIFGMGAVKDTEKIDLIIHLENWQQGKQYDRLGIATEYTNILGIDVPSLTIPVKPGRNLAVIIEVAAMNNRQKKMGYNAAQALNERIMESMSTTSDGGEENK